MYSTAVSLEKIFGHYLAVFIHPDWRMMAQTIVPPFLDQLDRTGQYSGSDGAVIDPNYVDAFLVSLMEAGHDIEQALAVLADALEFFVSRRAFQANPLQQFARGTTTRLSGSGPIAPITPAPPPESRPAPTTVLPYRTVMQAIDHFFPVVGPAGLRKTRDRFSQKTLVNTYLPKWLMLVRWLESRGVSDVRQVTRNHIKTYLDGLVHKKKNEKNVGKTKGKSIKNQSKNGHLAAIRALWAQIIDDGGIPEADDPTQVKRLKVKKEDKEKRYPLTITELALLLNHVNELQNEYVKRSYRALILAEAFGGPRASEAVAGDFRNVNWSTREFEIEEGKGGDPRKTILIQAAIDDLAWLRAYRGAGDSDAVFVNLPFGRGKKKADERLDRNSAWRWLSGLGKAVKVHLNNHLLRHTAGTFAEQFGGPAYRRALGADMADSIEAHSITLLGHKSAGVNKMYNTVSLSEVGKVMELAYERVMAEAKRLREKSRKPVAA